MIKNKEIKKLILIELLFLVLTVILSFVTMNIINDNYNQKLIDNNSYIIGNLLSKHPELEDDIIASIVLKDNYELGNQIIDKYQLNNIEIDYNYLILILALIIYLVLLVIDFIFIYHTY